MVDIIDSFDHVHLFKEQRLLYLCVLYKCNFCVHLRLIAIK